MHTLARDYSVQTRCPACMSLAIVYVREDDYNRWREGDVVQRAFPYLSIDERESLVTGYCPACWEHLFGGDDT